MLPFGGGSGGGVSIRPIAFLVVGREGVHIVPLDNQTHIFEKIIDATPGLIDKIQTMFQTNGINTGAVPGAAPYNPTIPATPVTEAGDVHYTSSRP
ncbi:putative spore protein YtfJ [compost metagenome]